MTESLSVAVVGAGAWGTALAALAAAGRAPGEAPVQLWAREAEVVDAINRDRINRVFLPGVTLPAGLAATSQLSDLRSSGAVLLVVPTQFLRQVASDLKPHLAPGVPLVICAKGIEIETGALTNEIIEAALPGHPVAVLSGPTFAIEVARGQPTAITLATADEGLGQKLIARLGRPTFRPYWSPDVIGAEVGGAVKNVLAIACGIVEGRGLGDNARAALITRGLAEIVRLGRAKGARMETLMGLSGLGDLVLTCSSRQSRNMSLGFALGEGQTLAHIMAERRSVAEGVATARAVVRVANTLGIDMPICAAVNAILHEGASVDEVVQGLLARPFRAETV